MGSLGLGLYPGAANLNTGGGMPILGLDNAGYMFWGGRSGTFDNTTQQTFQLTVEVPFVPVKMGMLIGNPALTSRGITGACFTSIPNWDDPNADGATWINQTFGSATSFAFSGSAATTRYEIEVPDLIDITPVPRDDGGDGCILVFREFEASSQAAIGVWGNGTDDFTNWATRPGSYKRIMRHSPGNCTNAGAGANPANFSSTTNRSQSPIVGFIFELADGQQVCVLGAHGDSIVEGLPRTGVSGDITYKGEGFIYPLAEALQATAKSGLWFVPANHGWSGTGAASFSARLTDAVTAGLTPDVAILPIGSPNNVTGTIDSTEIDTMRTQALAMLATCQSNVIPAVMWTWLPTNPSILDYGATDSLRIDYNDELINRTGDFASYTYSVANFSAALSGLVDGDGQTLILEGATSDDIHPNDTGKLILANNAKPVVRTVVYG